MSRLRCFALTLILLPGMAQAESVALADLGKLDLQFAPVEQLDSYQGQLLAARVTYRPGEAVSLVTPHRVQQMTYLVGDGDLVTAGQAIAKMSGPEIHHFLVEFQVTQRQLDVMQKRYDSNRKLYQNRAIDEARWIEISEAYYALQLKFEHMRHFHELLEPSDSDTDEDSIVLHAPTDGILQYRQDTPGIDRGEELALLVPASALRFKVSVPVTHRSDLQSLSAGGCELGVDSVSAIAQDFFVYAWSEPLSQQCRFLPGERLMVTPGYTFQGYRVPRQSVFQWQGEPTVLIRQQDRLTTVAVEIISGKGDFYAVGCGTDIAGGQLLSSSVSAVQGVLMGLGGE